MWSGLRSVASPDGEGIGAQPTLRARFTGIAIVSLPLGLLLWASDPPGVFTGPLLFGVFGITPLAFANLGDMLGDSSFRRIWAHSHLGAAALLAASFVVGRGALSVGLAVPWVAWTAIGAWRGRALLRGGRSSDVLSGFALVGLFVGAAFVLAARAGLTPLGLSPYQVELTALHFHFATLVPPIVVGAFLRASSFGERGLGRAVGTSAILGPLLIGIGTTVHRPTASIGTTFLSFALLAYAVGLLASLRTLAPPARIPLACSALCLLVAMPVVTVFSWTRAFATPPFDLGVVLRAHGYVNALGFALLSLVGWLLAHPSASLNGVAPSPVETRR